MDGSALCAEVWCGAKFESIGLDPAQLGLEVGSLVEVLEAAIKGKWGWETKFFFKHLENLGRSL
jgi:hypothetical protein